MLEVIPMILGPVETNAYLVADTQSGEAVVIDPAWDGQDIAAEAQRRLWRITGIWLTHAHFDHIAGAAGISRNVQPPPPVALHPADLPLWGAQGGAPLFGMRIDPGPPPVDLAGPRTDLARWQLHLRGAPRPGAYPGPRGLLLRCREARILWGCHLYEQHRPHRPARR